MDSRAAQLMLGALALLVGTAALVVAVANSSGEEGEQWRETGLALVVTEDGFKFDDVAPRAKSEEDVSAGDSFVFSNDVSGARRGRLLGGCAVADRGEPTCHVTYTFGDGQITVAGVPDFSQEAETFTIPVTGGSGAYESATGQVRVHENGRAEHDMTLRLPERD